MTHLDVPYSLCPKKAESRAQTIINLSAPTSRQYWSMCGRCCHRTGVLTPNSEPDQMLSIIAPSQFHGVELDPEIHSWNKTVPNFHWHNGDFYETMVEYANRNVFDPAIVNADMVVMPKFGVPYVAKILQFLTGVSGSTMFVANFVTSYRHMRAGIGDIVSGLEREPCYQYAMSSGRWRWHEEYYWYRGTGNGGTTMTTIVLKSS